MLPKHMAEGFLRFLYLFYQIQKAAGKVWFSLYTYIFVYFYAYTEKFRTLHTFIYHPLNIHSYIFHSNVYIIGVVAIFHIKAASGCRTAENQRMLQILIANLFLRIDSTGQEIQAMIKSYGNFYT